MPDKKPVDLIRRGEYGSDWGGIATFAGLHCLGPLIQLKILQTNPLDGLFSRATTVTNQPVRASHPSHPLRTIPVTSNVTSTPSVPSTTFPLLSPLSTTLGLSTPQTLLWTMSLLTATKHSYTAIAVTNEPMTPTVATIVAAFNTTLNSLNTLFFTVAASNPTYTDPSCLYVGAALFALGIIVEPLSEIQRKLFKHNPANKGKVYTGGLFGWARNINYGAYTVWRTGYALAGGGWVWGAVVCAFFSWNFIAERVPILEEYMGGKYGEQWTEAEKKVKWRLWPGIY